MPVFISHSQNDAPLYSTICYAFDAIGLPRWDVLTMSVGLSLPDQLQQAIKRCDACVFIATKRSVESTWCMAEMGAFWGVGKTVAIFMADSEVNKDDLPPQFAENLRTSNIAQIIKTVKGCLPASETASMEDTSQKLYEDVNDILNQLEDEESSKEAAFRVRQRLNVLFLDRDPRLSVPQAKELLERLGHYSRGNHEHDTLSKEVDHAFIHAVRKFQLSQRISIKDGIVGPRTAQGLFEAIEAIAAQPA